MNEVRAVFHTALVQLRLAPKARKRLRRRLAIRKLGGKCEACGIDRHEVLEIHHTQRNGTLHAAELARHHMTLTEWVIREENPRAGRYAVALLCLNCHRLEHEN